MMIILLILGDEKEAWSDDDDDRDIEQGTEKSAAAVAMQRGRAGHPDSIKAAEQVKDGYSSGDLGDVSQFYATEVPDEKDSDSDTEATPRKSFKERYAMASKDKDDSTNRPGQVVVPDIPPVPVGVVTEDSEGAGKQDVNKVVSEAPPTQDEGEEGSDLPSNDLVDRILEAMWGYCHAYHISNAVSYRCNR
jgi:hypothetical protein